MRPVFLQPEQLCMAEQLSSMSNRSAPWSNPSERIIASDLSAESGHVICLPRFCPPLIYMLQAYWWPICLRHGSLLTH